MKPRTLRPSSSKEVVGTVPLWELWAASQVAAVNRGQELLDAGAFTAVDFAEKTGWARSKAKHYLITLRLKRERAYDTRLRGTRQVWFYFPPDEVAVCGLKTKKAPRKSPLGALKS